MALTKSNTNIWNGTTLTAGAGDTTSSAVDLTASYGASVSFKITNGATGPTIPAQVLIQTSPDNSNYYSFAGPFVSATGNSVVTSWGDIELPLGTQYLKLVAGSNTAQNVTVQADVSKVTGI